MALPKPEMRTEWAWVDAAIVLALFASGLILYGPFALRLAEGRLFEYYNLAFDFDSSRALSMLTGSPPDGMGFKHPLMIALRPFGLALLALGLPEKAAAGLVMAGTGAASLVVAYLFLRACRIAIPEAMALALLFAVSGAQIFTAIIPESYGFALLSLALVWLVAQLRVEAPGRWGAARYAAAVFATGITITNAMQPVIAEMAEAWREGGGARRWLRRMVVYGVIFCAVFLACALLLWGRTIMGALLDPIGTAKMIWWLQTQGEKTGPGAVLQALLVFSFVSPDFQVVPLPETTRMLDFRDWVYSPLGTFTAVLWISFLGTGTVAGLLHRGYRPIALAILAALLVNLVFHMQYQYRGSIYIYAAHTHFLAFALAAGLAPWMGALPRLRWAYLGMVLALAAFLGAVNLPVAADFSTRFDRPETSCPAPCS